MKTTASRHESLFIAGPAGPVEALLWAPSSETQPALAAVVCHPHPLFGGTMHNKVVYQTAKALHSFGLPVLRFNFRGVGQSAGTYDGGVGEAEDVVAALDRLVAEFPGAALIAAGFSFGAWVGMRVGCADARVSELIGLGLPLDDAALDFAYLRDCAKPKLLIIGDRDQYAAREKVEDLAAALSANRMGETRLKLVPDADHFFTGHLEEMTRALGEWLVERHPESQRNDL